MTFSLLALSLAGCAVGPTLGSELTAAIGDSDGGVVVLASFDAVEGSMFLVICPYESKTSVEDRLGFTWEDAPDYSQVDDRQTIAIISDGDIASHVELTRDVADFCSAGQWQVLPVDTPLDVTRSADAVRVSVQG